VTDTSTIRTLIFTLKLYFMYDQDPISVPFVIEVYPCNTATFTVPVPPANLVIDRVETSSHTSSVVLDPTYNVLFLSNYLAHCPV